MSEYLTKLKSLSKDLKAKEKKSQKLREQSQEVTSAQRSLADKEAGPLLRDIVMGEGLLKKYKWEALWQGYHRYQTCDGYPIPVTLGVHVDKCKHADPIERLMEQLPGIDRRGLILHLQDGVELHINPLSYSAGMRYIIVFTKIDMLNFLPWFKQDVSKAVCIANAQVVADFVKEHELTVKPPHGFKQTLKEHREALEMGEKISSLIGLVGFKKKTKKPTERKYER